MVPAFPFENLQKVWAFVWSDTEFVPFSISLTNRKLHVQWACGSSAMSYVIQVECLWLKILISVLDPDLEIRKGPGHPHPEICGGEGGSLPSFFRFSLKIRGWRPSCAGPSPRSTKGSPHVGESGFPKTGNFCLNLEFWKFLLVGSVIL